MAKAGVGEFGGVHAGALPEVGAVGSSGEVAEGDVGLGGRFVFRPRSIARRWQGRRRGDRRGQPG